MSTLTMDFDDSFNFELDDPPLLASNKRKKKVIGLDDLFKDHKKEQERKKKGKLTVVKQKACESDDDEDATNATENKLTEALHGFRKTICEVDGHDGALNDLGNEDVTSSWGLQVFGSQKSPSLLVVPQLEECMLLQASLNNEDNLLLDNSSPMGESLLEGLLLNGWLSKLIITYGVLEESIAKWTLNLLFYSSEESLMASSCDFWCAILCNKVDTPAIKVEWIPGFLELKTALDCFGFQLHSSANVLPHVESSFDGTDRRGPPPNIRAWIKFADGCCQVRNRYLVLSTGEVEEFIGILISLFLDRQLLGLTGALHDCLLSAINFFEEKEWSSSCEKVAISIANRIPRDLNCLRAVGCISGVDTRSKQLRSAVAYQFLTSCYDELQMADGRDVLRFLVSKRLKDRSCNLFNIYLCLVLAENWLLFDTETKHQVTGLWTEFVEKCSKQISNTDFRPCAQEIRNRALYILHSKTGD